MRSVTVGLAQCLIFTLAAVAGPHKYHSRLPLDHRKIPALRAGHKRYIVVLRDDVDSDKFAASKRIVPAHSFHELFSGFSAELTNRQRLKLRADKRVRFVEEDKPLAAGNITPLSLVPGQTPSTGLQRMNIVDFPLSHINGATETHPIGVAVLDSGIDPHEDLPTIPPEHCFSPFSDTCTDDLGHGTAVAGIIAETDNHIGAVGGAAGVDLWNIKVIGTNSNSWTNVLSGMEFVYENKDQIAVANISISGNGPYSSIRVGAIKLVRAGVVVVGAVGNDNQDIAGPDGLFGTADDILPGTIPEVLAVSAMDSSNVAPAGSSYKSADVFWHASTTEGTNYSDHYRAPPTDNPDPTVVYPVSTGGAIALAAPGVKILTTGGGIAADGLSHNYVELTGTSAAAPHVSFLAALYIIANGRAYDEKGVYKIEQTLINESQRAQPQTVWASTDTQDSDSFHEALAYPSLDSTSPYNWVPNTHENVFRSDGLTGGVPQQMTIQAWTNDPTNCYLAPCSLPGYQYTFQYSDNWGPWTNLAAPILGDGNIMQVVDPNASQSSARFYRILRTAAP